MSKKTLVLTLGLLIVALALGFWAFKNPKKDSGSPNNNSGQNNQNQDLGTKVEIKEVDKNLLPDKFPADFPIEAGAQILKNYNSEDDDVYQATRQFASKKTVAENYKYYTDYFKANGWKITGSNDGSTIKSVTAEKGGGKISISISQNVSIKAVVVNVNYTVAK